MIVNHTGYATEEINLITRGGIGCVNVQCWIIKPAHYAPNQSVCTMIAPFLCVTFSNTEWSNHFTINISVVGPLQRYKKACCQMSRFPVPPLINCLLIVTAKQANGISRWFRPQVEGWHSKLGGGGVNWDPPWLVLNRLKLKTTQFHYVSGRWNRTWSSR